MCGELFKRRSPRQKYCGNREDKTSCAYKARRVLDNIRKREYRKTHDIIYNSPKNIFAKYIHNAKRRNIIFNITFDDFMNLWGKDCYYCGCQIKTIGIDRKNPKKGYNINNIVPCCKTCNISKMSLTEKQFIKMAKRVARNF